MEGFEGRGRLDTSNMRGGEYQKDCFGVARLHGYKRGQDNVTEAWYAIHMEVVYHL
jgi:hypothetical protein